MNGLDAYKYYTCLRLHFTTDWFNVFTDEDKENYKQVFDCRNDRLIFEDLAKQFSDKTELVLYFVSNFAYQNEGFLYNFESASNCFFEWTRRRKKIIKKFEEDLDLLYSSQSKDVDVPLYLQLYAEGKMAIESLCILDGAMNGAMLKQIKQDEVVKVKCRDIIHLIEKTKPFVKYNQDEAVLVMSKKGRGNEGKNPESS